jgi:hypothetical protein
MTSIYKEIKHLNFQLTPEIIKNIILILFNRDNRVNEQDLK